jgi:hypothetical protein
MTPIEASIFHVTGREKCFSFGYPLKSISIFNDGPNNVRLRVGNSGYHTIGPDASVDLDFDSGVKNIYLSTSTGEANVKFLGVRKFENQYNQEKPVYKPQQVFIPYQTNKSDFNLNFALTVGLILVSIVAIVAIMGMVITKK